MTVSAQTMGGGAPAGTLSLPWIIGASSVGTLIEWYDFYLYGTLAVFFAKYFFPPGNENLALLASLAVFWFGFILRPFGALFFYPAGLRRTHRQRVGSDQPQRGARGPTGSRVSETELMHQRSSVGTS